MPCNSLIYDTNSHNCINKKFILQKNIKINGKSIKARCNLRCVYFFMNKKTKETLINRIRKNIQK